MLTMQRLITALVLIFAAALSGAQEVPMGVEAFTKAAAERVQREVPSYDIAPTIRLTLEGKRADDESTGQISLDRVYAFCSRNIQNCSAALDQFARGIGESIKERDRPIDKSMVRLAVRPSDYLERVKRQMGPGPFALYARPIGGGLALIPVLDFAHAIRFVGEKDLSKLHVTEDELYKLGEQNLRATMKPISEVTSAPAHNSIGNVTGEDYASSRIAFHDDWKNLAEKLHGNLVVMLPAPDNLLYGDGSTAEGVDALRILGHEMARRSPRPLPLVVLRWSPDGWDELK